MKVEFWWIGKTQAKYLMAPLLDFEKRISHFQKFSIREFSSIRTKDHSRLKEEEGKSFLNKINTGDYIVLLDEKGTSYSSVQFADYVNKLQLQGMRRIIFIAGGSHGFSDDMYTRGDALLSLSEMTFTHEMVRLIFLEQLYRAYAINNHLPYHHV